MTENVEFEQPVVSNEATPSGSFFDALPEDLRNDASLKDFKDVGSLAKSYVNAQRMIGSSIRIPGEDASPEAKAEFYAKLSNVPGVLKAPNPEDPESVNQLLNVLGRPESHDGYKFDIPEGVEAVQEELAEFNKYAHQLGLTQSQYKGVLDKYIEIASQEEAAHISPDQGRAELQKMWGPEFNTRLEAAKSVMEAYSEKYPDAMDALINSPAGNNPALIAMLSELAPMFQEKGVIGGQTKFQFGMSSDEAMDKISEITSNKSHAYWNSSDPNHSAAVERVNKLYQIAYHE